MAEVDLVSLAEADVAEHPVLVFPRHLQRAVSRELVGRALPGWEQAHEYVAAGAEWRHVYRARSRDLWVAGIERSNGPNGLKGSTLLWGELTALLHLWECTGRDTVATLAVWARRGGGKVPATLSTGMAL